MTPGNVSGTEQNARRTAKKLERTHPEALDLHSLVRPSPTLFRKKKNEMVDLDAAFAAVNTSKTGKITASEVQAALALANLSFSLQTCALAVRLHDADGDGCITRGEFAALHSSLDGLNSAFGELSGAGPGASDDAPGIDLEKTEAALKKVDIELDRPALAAAFGSFDPSKDGKLCASEFIGLALFLRAAKAAFRAFDSVRERQRLSFVVIVAGRRERERGGDKKKGGRDRRKQTHLFKTSFLHHVKKQEGKGTITMNRDQFIYAAASCR